MMVQNIDVIFTIADYRNIAYVIFLLVALIVERKITSIVVVLFVLAIGENLTNELTQSILEISRQDGIEYKFVWYGFWSTYSLFGIYTIYFLHNKLKIRASSGANFVSFIMLFWGLCQVVDFIDRVTWDSAFFAAFYQYSIVVTNLLITPMLLLFWLRDIHKERFVKYKEV